MKNYWKSALSMLLCCSLLFSGVALPQAAALAEVADGEASGEALAPENPATEAPAPEVPLLDTAALTTADMSAVTYPIYPIPREITYGATGTVIPSAVNVVYGTGIDAETKARTAAALACLRPAPTVTEQAAAVAGAFNILVGVKSSGDAADLALADMDATMTVVNAGATTQENIFTSTKAFDGYMVRVTDNQIAVVGRNTDAAFYGVTTLKHIFTEMAQTSTPNLRLFALRDYASVGRRGFIEGFYGIPWSSDNRKALMQWGGEWKMNAYVYAPKDDPKHNSKWREQYTAAELEQFRGLAAAGNESKCRFIYALHTFMNAAIRFDTEAHYQEDLKIVTDKFESLYNVGVRQFAILADDAGGTTAENIIRLCNDADTWGKTKGDVLPVVHCPTSYNASWTNAAGFANLGKMNQNLHSDIEIMWTGKGVCGHADQEGGESFTHNIDVNDGLSIPVRKPLMWLNWPVDDINMKRLVMGPGSNEGGTALWNTGSVAVLNRGDADYFSGIISNPMQQANLNRAPLFAVADFSWNDDAYDGQKSWADSFRYIDPEAGASLHEMSKHLSDPAPNTHGMECGESEEIKTKLSDFSRDYLAGTPIKAQSGALIAEFDKIITACDDYARLSQNAAMKQEIEPHRLALREICAAGKAFVQTAVALEDHNAQDVWSHYSTGTAEQAKSTKHVVLTLGGSTFAQSGSKRIMPFVKTVGDALAKPVQQVIDPSQSTAPANTFYYSDNPVVHAGELKNAIDGNTDTFVQPTGQRPAGASCGIRYGEPTEISYFQLLTGCGTYPGDIITDSVLEYRVEGSETFQAVPGGGAITQKDTKWDFSDAPLRNVVEIRARHRSVVASWMVVREMGVCAPFVGEVADMKYPATAIATTGMVEYSALTNMVDASDTTYAHVHHNGSDTVQPGEFVGIDLGAIKSVGTIRVLQGQNNTNGDKMKNAVLEYSTDNVTYTEIKSNINENTTEIDRTANPINARYIRLRNTEAISAWAAIRDFSATSPYVPIFNSTGIGYKAGSRNDLSDGNDSTSASFAKVPYETGDNTRDSIAAGEYVGFKLPAVQRLGRIRILQGNNNTHGDKLKNATLEYSEDGTTYTPIKTNINDNVIDMDLTSSGIRAQYVRLRNGTEATGKWLVMRTFSVDKATSTERVFTNAVAYQNRYCVIGTDSAAVTPMPTDVTLQPNEYLGLKLPRIRELTAITAPTVAGLTVQAGCNLSEMNAVSGVSAQSPLNARYIVLKNTSAAPVTFAYTGMTVRSNEIQRPVETANTMGGVYEGNGIANAFDGSLATQTVLADEQDNGESVTIDLGQTRTINSLQVISSDSEQDYIRNAKVETSTDGTTWQDLMTLGGAGSGTATPITAAAGWTHTTSYCYTGSKEGDAPLGATARYLRITQVLTEHVAKWTRMHEIAINSLIRGNEYVPEYVPTVNDPTFVATQPQVGHEAVCVADGNVSTTYRPSAATGSLLYRISENTADIRTMTILQSPNTVSNAKVSVRAANAASFVEVGTMHNSLNEFNLTPLGSVAEVKLEWNGTAPEIHEILFGKTAPSVTGKTFEELTQAIAAAQTLLTGVVASDNGADVAISDKWAPAAEIAAFTSAITEARKVNSFDTATAIDTAYTVLASAQAKFNGALRNGGKVLITAGSKDPTKGTVSMKKADGTVIAPADVKVNDLVKLYAEPQANQRFVKWTNIGNGGTGGGGSGAMDTFAFEGTQTEYTANPLILRAADAVVLQAEFAAIDTAVVGNPMLEMLTATAAPTNALRDATQSVVLIGADGTEGFLSGASAANVLSYDAYLLSGETSIKLSATFNPANTVTINGTPATSANGGVGTPTVVTVTTNNQQIPVAVTAGGKTTTYTITVHTTAVNPKMELRLVQKDPTTVEGQIFISNAHLRTAQFMVGIDSAAAAKFDGFTDASGTALTALTAANGFAMDPEMAAFLQVPVAAYDATNKVLAITLETKLNEALSLDGTAQLVGKFYLKKGANVTLPDALASLVTTKNATGENAMFDVRYRGLYDDAKKEATSLTVLSAEGNALLYSYLSGMPGMAKTRITCDVFTSTGGVLGATPLNVARIPVAADGRMEYEVASGTYVIKVYADGYLTYTSAPLTVAARTGLKVYISGGTLTAGDVDGNAVINSVDRTTLLTVFNQAAANGKANGVAADFDDDGSVNAIDLGRLLLNYTK